jgi:hypothetical protein
VLLDLLFSFREMRLQSAVIAWLKLAFEEDVAARFCFIVKLYGLVCLSSVAFEITNFHRCLPYQVIRPSFFVEALEGNFLIKIIDPQIHDLVPPWRFAALRVNS